MKKFIIILLFVFIISVITGLILKQIDYPKANLIIGLSVFLLAFILMPCFIYYRYRDGKYKKYQINDKTLFNLTKENDTKK